MPSFGGGGICRVLSGAASCCRFTSTSKSGLARSEDFRPEFEKRHFEHDQEEIYGYATYYSPERGESGADEITPPIREPSEIWPLICGPLLWIRCVRNEDWDQTIRFVMSFDCQWDEEHGLDIAVADWR